MQIDINYENGLSDIANKIENNFADIIGQGAQTVCESAKSLCPVDTGRLQSSINVQPGGNTAVISADTEYARLEYSRHCRHKIRRTPSPYNNL